MGIMEFASKLRWFLVITAFILFLILVGWGLYSIASSIFRSGVENSGGSGSQQTTSSPEDTVLFSAQASIETEGPVVAASEQFSYKIEVSSGVVSMRVYQAYGAKLFREKSYLNSPESYDAFLHALSTMNVTARREGSSPEDDFSETGICPTGRRYVFELDSSLRRWSTSCSAEQGTAGFSMGPVRSLFQRQVPDFSELVSGTGL